MTTTLDVAGLRDLVAMLRELEAAGRFLMDYWAVGPVTPDATSWTECGTLFCAAGAKAVSDGWRPQYRLVHGKTVATGCFVRPENRYCQGEDDEVARPAYGIARESLGLTYEQASFLFHPCHISRVDDLAVRVEHVIMHSAEFDPADSFPGALKSVEFDHADADRERVHSLLSAADGSV